MPRIQPVLYAALTLSVLAAVATAAPMIPPSAIGTDQAIVVTSAGRIDIIRGGLFGGTIEGYAASFWCVDPDNYVNPTQSYRGNVTLLGAWSGGTNPEVQKGMATGSSWIYQGLTPLVRYQAAAYLITQTQAYQAGVDVAGDDDYQRAIWSLLDLAPQDNVTETAQAITYRTAAVSHILSNPTYGFGTWAVVSGAVDSRGALECSRVQTFLTQVQTPVPEPGTYAMMGAGLTGLALLARRKRA